MATFILVHGAWHGGWCWERVTPLLEAAGHRVLAPDLPGMGQDRTPFAADTLGQWAEFVADLVSVQSEPVILAGHSRGGAVISEAGERAPDRIARLVYLAAFLLPAGETPQKFMAAHSSRAGVAIPNADGLTLGVDRAKCAPIFYNLSSKEDAAAAAARLCPEPLASMTQPLRVTDGQFGRIRRTYIETLQDKAITLEMQRVMQRNLPCDQVLTLKSDHSPFCSMPDQLAKAFMRCAREI